MNETIITLTITAILVALTVVPYLNRMHRKETEARDKFRQMKITGLDEATAMHPHIDAIKCIGCGACVRACPEGDVLAVIDGKATLIHGAKCIGHGLCAEACPVGAIELLMAKPGRSANLPILSENYETNVEGVFIVGELGGLALIKNAVMQGTKAVEYISESMQAHAAEYDIAIIGAGPAGLASGLTALKNNLRYIVLEQSNIGGTVLQYPRSKIVMTSPVELPLWGKIKFTEVSKETLLETWMKILEKTSLKINTEEKVTDVSKQDGIFTIASSRQRYTARYVVLALGRRGSPRKLGVPGEERSKVVYSLIDASSYQQSHMLVVGGGDSAIEAAVGLASQKNNTVTLSYRKGEFSRIKERNKQHLEEYVAKKKITVVFNSEVKDILEKSVLLTVSDVVHELPNDYVFIFAGGELPNEFLKKIGVQLNTQSIQ
jgi:thioredoxin reductase (NADPH)